MEKEKLIKIIYKNLNILLKDLKKGYSFVRSDFSINKQKIDLLLYNRINNCYVLVYVITTIIDLSFLEDVKKDIEIVNKESLTNTTFALIITKKNNIIEKNKYIENNIEFIFYDNLKK